MGSERTAKKLYKNWVRLNCTLQNGHRKITLTRAFLDYVRTNSATGGFATEIAAEVNRVKASSVAKREYMTLAMEIQRQIAQEKDKWFAEGEATRSRTIALRLLQGGMPMEQVAAYTDLTADQVQELGQQ